MYLNSYITHNDQQYAIYWTSQWAQHVLENYTDPGHGVDHTTISRILKRARSIVPKSGRGLRRPYVHVCLTSYQGLVYETYVHLVPELDGWPARCVVITCYKSTRPEYWALFTAEKSV